MAGRDTLIDQIQKGADAITDASQAIVQNPSAPAAVREQLKAIRRETDRIEQRARILEIEEGTP